MNSTDNLVRMANSIGDFFAAMPDEREALDGIAGHIRKFWEPRMRRAIFAHLDTHAGVGLDPLVLRSLSQHREVLQPSPPDEVPPPTGG